jgi:uncharacterized surface protein with fasciclin (FAS1) repeats
VKQIRLIFISIVSVFFLQACSDDDEAVIVPAPLPVVTNTIVDVAVADGNFTTLVAALQATGLDATLADTSQSFTVFAPTDDAFALLGQETIDALLADTDQLTGILTYHVLPGAVDANTAISLAGTTVDTVNGAPLALSLADDNLLVNVVTVTATDIVADNGIIHVVDAVITVPGDNTPLDTNIVETAIGDGRFTTLVAALEATELDAVLADESANFTVFAPTDDAFALLGQDNINNLLANTDILSEILLQHVLSVAVDSTTAFTYNGATVTTEAQAEVPIRINYDTDMLTFGGANVIIKDIYTSNGIIHVIDAVIVGNVELPEAPMSITDVAAGNDDFSILVEALQVTGLDATLDNMDANFTVFAPTNAAFDKLADGALETLLADPDYLSGILLYHVYTSGTVLADTAISIAQSGESVITMGNTEKLALSFNESTLFANGSRIVMADVMAANGVIHVIDNIILPPRLKGYADFDGSIADYVIESPDTTTLATALTAAGLVDTLDDETSTFTVFAPANVAFDKIPEADLNALLADVPALTSVLLQHVVPGEVDAVSAFAANGTSVETAEGNSIAVKVDPESGALMYGDSTILISNIFTNNGVIHLIDVVVTD